MDELSQSVASNKPTLNVNKESKRIIEDKQCQIEELQLKYNQIERKLSEYEKTRGTDQSYNKYNQNSHTESVKKESRRVLELENIISQNNEVIIGLKMRQHELESELDSLRKELKRPSSAHKHSEIQEDYEKMMLDYEELKDERDQLKEAMNEAINQCANSLVKQQTLEKDNQRLLKQVESLANSKLLIQTTMADQINSLRGQVQRLKEERNEKSIRISNE